MTGKSEVSFPVADQPSRIVGSSPTWCAGYNCAHIRLSKTLLSAICHLLRSRPTAKVISRIIRALVVFLQIP